MSVCLFAYLLLGWDRDFDGNENEIKQKSCCFKPFPFEDANVFLLPR